MQLGLCPQELAQLAAGPLLTAPPPTADSTAASRDLGSGAWCPQATQQPGAAEASSTLRITVALEGPGFLQKHQQDVPSPSSRPSTAARGREGGWPPSLCIPHPRHGSLTPCHGPSPEMHEVGGQRQGAAVKAEVGGSY